MNTILALIGFLTASMSASKMYVVDLNSLSVLTRILREINIEIWKVLIDKPALPVRQAVDFIVGKNTSPEVELFGMCVFLL